MAALGMQPHGTKQSQSEAQVGACCMLLLHDLLWRQQNLMRSCWMRAHSTAQWCCCLQHTSAACSQQHKVHAAPCHASSISSKENLLTCWRWCNLQDPAKAEQRRAAAEAALAAAQRSDKQLVTETRRFAGKDIQVRPPGQAAVCCMCVQSRLSAARVMCAQPVDTLHMSQSLCPARHSSVQPAITCCPR